MNTAVETSVKASAAAPPAPAPPPAPAAAPLAPPAAAAVVAARALGAAHAVAMRAEADAVAAGAGAGDLEGITAEILGAAGCEEFLDAMRLLSWRAQELSRALEFVNLGGPRGTDDPMMVPIVVTGAALADLVTACCTIRDSTSENSARDEAAESWRHAIAALTRLTGNEPVSLAAAPKRLQ